MNITEPNEYLILIRYTPVTSSWCVDLIIFVINEFDNKWSLITHFAGFKERESETDVRMHGRNYRYRAFRSDLTAINTRGLGNPLQAPGEWRIEIYEMNEFTREYRLVSFYIGKLPSNHLVILTLSTGEVIARLYSRRGLHSRKAKVWSIDVAWVELTKVIRRQGDAKHNPRLMGTEFLPVSAN